MCKFSDAQRAAKLVQPATIKGKLPASERRTRDIFVCENSRAEEKATDFVCAVPFAPFWAPKGWIEATDNKIATKIKGKNCRRIQNNYGN
jgi:hypothetical protein